MMTILGETFGDRLSTLRTSLHLTTQQLADCAGVPQSLICGLQAGSRHVGENNARKIGHALKLSGAELEDFVYLAINDSSDRVLAQHKAYPAEVLNLVAEVLASSGISADRVRKCIRPSSESKPHRDARVFLNDGHSATISVTVEQA